MSRNIKEIGKELMGKSLNSFHRKTGLPQLERNNEMQDGILDGILSQVDDAYIEKTEQSNVIHLEGSGDGVVVLDSIEGNTMVNVRGEMNTNNCQWQLNNGWWELSADGVLFLDFKAILKQNSIYTVVYEFKSENNCGIQRGFRMGNGAWVGTSTSSNIQGLHKVAINTNGTEVNRLTFHKKPYETTDKVSIRNIMILEGDWTNKEIPASYFEGLQSSFEEKVNSEGKHEIEILSHKGRPNELKNSFNELQASPREYMSISITDIAKKYLGKRLVVSGKVKSIGKNGDVRIYSLGKYSVGFSTLFNCNTSNYINFVCEGRFTYESNGANGEACNLSFYGIYDSGIFPCVKDIKIEILDDNDNILATEWCPSYKDDEIHWKNHKNSNKIKLLINEPLRGTNVSKDMLCIKDGKLVIERRYKQIVLNGNVTEKWQIWKDNSKTYRWNSIKDIECNRHIGDVVCDKIPRGEYHQWWNGNLALGIDYGDPNGRTDISSIYICQPNLDENVASLRQWLSENNLQVVLPLKEPYYEEVLNEYGEPILLEGYENGTVYIDSTIVPTTTVRYTPKMESFNTLKEVYNNNVMLTSDVNDNIIPYMMDVDLMIMEKEMALMSHKNIRKMEVLDMTSMQKRTQDMLERLIKGKSLTEQECKTRVTTYLNAGKITDEQAEELMLLIDEVYA